MSNLIKLSLAVLVLLAGLGSCKKSEVKAEPLASLNVIAAVIGGGNVKLNTNVRDSAKAYNAKVFGIVPGKEIKLYRVSNPTVNYYKETPVTENGGLYSVFLAGQGSAFEPIFKKESIPAFYKDSIIGVRIVNLSPNSTALNVTRASATSTNAFAGVTYKQITDFVTFPLKTVIPTGSVSFQIRNAAGTLLATYTLPTSANSNYPGISIALQRFKNISIVIKGLMGTTTGPDAFGVFPVVTTY
ncbi:hypothetical protein HDC92_001677 [Pedobacter sp. AK017]|uniref:DUF4397 domain-containing protein n=1 Tax=Pedobacter sp. AK017 TaxID=2723073 RepID=UPI001611542C|nr:DUF4397 domain-containing protein [Pedobacter sp. AK017]MBB5438002.1 hypothetical protein [Pedobacter sp. AK017]